MASLISDEIMTLNDEFKWLLQEVNWIIKQIHNIIVECSRRFPVPIDGVETMVKTEKYILASMNNAMNDQIKVSCTLCADNITHADINIRLHKHPQVNHRTIVQNDCQWKLHQILDASNHLRSALNILDMPPLRFNDNIKKFDFKTAEEVIELINNIMVCLDRGRKSLVVPKKRSIEELQRSSNMKSLQPPLPNDLAISFYIQANKLICAVYHMYKDGSGQKKFDISQAEISIPWLNEALVSMAVNFSNDNLVKITCDQVSNDGHCIENLISNNPDISRNGFLVEYYIRPPVTIIIDFIKYSFDLLYLELGLRLRVHKSNGIEIYTKRYSDYVLVGRYRDQIPDILTVVNEGYRLSKLLPSHDKIYSNVHYVSGNKWKNCCELKSIKIRIFSSENSSVPCLGFLNLYGKPFGLKKSNLAEFLATIPRFDNQPKLENENKRRLDPSELEQFAPLEFMDSITNEIMRTPYLLPSNKNIDKTTLDRYLDGKTLEESKDPFTNISFNDTYKPQINHELKSRIDLFINTDGQSEIERRQNLRNRLLNNS
ncbi:uncharacterized protein LOC124493062 [Dermatophagoides farinae]|uniref:uncharacterized protein LOC124493062 n=1 Tax=Dermatophagoides farinae TaxID=6954 RepID=UPI001F0D9C6E|nr:uncharacterized protein LOC124493062 [Dermatophagoides farinae]